MVGGKDRDFRNRRGGDSACADGASQVWVDVTGHLAQERKRGMKKVTVRVWRSAATTTWFCTVSNDNAESVKLLGNRDPEECKRFAEQVFNREIKWQDDGMGDFKFVIDVEAYR